jgi:hypothetical protein
MAAQSERGQTLALQLESRTSSHVVLDPERNLTNHLPTPWRVMGYRSNANSTNSADASTSWNTK